MRIVSDIHGLERAAPPQTAVDIFSAQSYPSRWRRNFRLLTSAIGANYLVVHFSLAEVLFFAIGLRLIPFHHCRLVTLDFFVVRPKRWQMPLIKWSLRRVNRLLVYFRDSARFEALYGLPAGSFRYIPFKVNSWEIVRAAAVSDEGYIFVGGRSRRDFRTLFEAIKDLPIPVKVLTADEPELLRSGSSLAGFAQPSNVEIFYNDSDSRFFVAMAAKARLVVLPILSDSAVQAGIGVYLIGMALQKCVIVSEAPGVSDVLLNGEAYIVPPGDVASLRAAIQRLWYDDELRLRYAMTGYRYATPLAGEDRLFTSILDAVREEIAENAGMPAGGSHR